MSLPSIGPGRALRLCFLRDAPMPIGAPQDMAGQAGRVWEMKEPISLGAPR